MHQSVSFRCNKRIQYYSHFQHNAVNSQLDPNSNNGPVRRMAVTPNAERLLVYKRGGDLTDK